MYCHSTMYCQKAFVPSMCAHFYLLPIDAEFWEESQASFPPSPSSFHFGTSAIWFKWAPLQLASLQLWHFMNCCAAHYGRSHHHLFTFCLPEKFFCLLLANALLLTGKDECITNCSAVKAKHFSPFESFVFENHRQAIWFPCGLSLPLQKALCYF